MMKVDNVERIEKKKRRRLKMIKLYGYTLVYLKADRRYEHVSGVRKFWIPVAKVFANYHTKPDYRLLVSRTGRQNASLQQIPTHNNSILSVSRPKKDSAVR